MLHAGCVTKGSQWALKHITIITNSLRIYDSPEEEFSQVPKVIIYSLLKDFFYNAGVFLNSNNHLEDVRLLESLN